MATVKKYLPNEFEEKWAKEWVERKTYKTEENVPEGKQKDYILDMFPYPSGAGLHVGHVEGYTATDIYSRFKRMNGYAVLHPIGWDAFGLPAENYAVKTNVHPQITTAQAINTFRSQLQRVGISYDWDREIGTHTPEYYKWTQWLFLYLYKKGLAYRKKAPVNWCPGVCQTVLANEQVVDGKCERCDTPVIQKKMEQWFFKITDYAERLLEGLDKIDWPESTKMGQRNWIGKSVGAEITYPIDKTELEVTVFSTRPDTNFGATFIVLAPDSDFVAQQLDKMPNSKEVKDYVAATKKKTELERQQGSKEKTGVFTGWYGVNRLNDMRLPVYVADYVLAGVGTGAVVGVPAHDLRDFEFAKAFGLEVIRVVGLDKNDTSPVKSLEDVLEKEGIVVNSAFLDGLNSADAKKKIIEYLEEKNWGEAKTTYRLRDWLVCRQRFWGAPVPMWKKKVGEHYEYTPVDESELPVLLPMDVDFKPTGVSPLTNHPDFKDREVDTIDTFVCSSWYFLRFCDPHNSKEFANTDKLKEWLPVNMYVGGAEHTVLHLLYSRFITKVLYDDGLINFDEPFLKLRHPGIILGPDSRKMSKRWGNVINPSDVCNEFGADTLRMYEMFMGPFADSKPWNTSTVQGVYRFLARIWKLYHGIDFAEKTENKLEVKLHKTIKKVTQDLPELKFNTAIASMMEFINAWEKELTISKNDALKFLLILAPFAPFATEEIFQTKFVQEKSKFTSVHIQTWPKYNNDLLVEKKISIPVQVDGRVRAVIDLETGLSQQVVVDLALAQEKVQKYLGSSYEIRYIPDKILNFVVNKG